MYDSVYSRKFIAIIISGGAVNATMHLYDMLIYHTSAISVFEQSQILWFEEYGFHDFRERTAAM